MPPAAARPGRGRARRSCRDTAGLGRSAAGLQACCCRLTVQTLAVLGRCTAAFTLGLESWKLWHSPGSSRRKRGFATSSRGSEKSSFLQQVDFPPCCWRPPAHACSCVRLCPAAWSTPSLSTYSNRLHRRLTLNGCDLCSPGDKKQQRSQGSAGGRGNQELALRRLWSWGRRLQADEMRRVPGRADWQRGPTFVCCPLSLAPPCFALLAYSMLHGGNSG